MERVAILFGVWGLGCSEGMDRVDESPAGNSCLPRGTSNLDVPDIVVDLENLPSSPVVALITVDTWRADHFTAGLTPSLWALGQEGEYFSHAMSPMGLTSPAHATMFTGKMPWEHGMEGNNHHGYVMRADLPVLSDRFEGFRTAAFVSAYPAGPEGGLGRGWDEFSGPEEGERPGWEAVQQAIEWLKVDQPSLLWVHLYEPHGPYLGEGSTDRERYAEEVSRADQILNPLVTLLKARGARIVVAGDHGEVLDEETCGRQHERSSSDHVLRVPLVRWSPELQSKEIEGIVGLDQVPALLMGEAWKEESVWLAESGMCEPGCSRCSPEGLTGRDRVAIGLGGRLTHRPGQGWIEEGTPDPAWKGQLLALPELPLPPGEQTSEQVRSLGY